MPSKKTSGRKSKDSTTPRESIEKVVLEGQPPEDTEKTLPETEKTPQKETVAESKSNEHDESDEEPTKEIKAKGKGKKPVAKGKTNKKTQKDDTTEEPKTPPKKQDKKKEDEESQEESPEQKKKETKAKGKSNAKSPKKITAEEDSTKDGKKEVSSPMKRRIPNIRLDPIPKKLKPIEEKRRRRSIDRLVMVVSPNKSATKFDIPEGKGTKLKKCPNVFAQISKRTNSDPLLRTIHGLVIGRPNKQVKVKDNLGKFCGLVYADEDGRANITARIERLKVRTLRDMLAFFGQDPKGDVEDLVTRLVDFFEDPQPSDQVYKCSPKSRGLTPTPIKKLKRPLTAFTLFSKDKRAEFAKKHPDEKFGEISKRLGEAWKKLDDEEKEDYMDQAAKEKSKYQRAKKKLELASD